MCEASCDLTVKEGHLWKRPRGQHRSVGPNAKFEKRLFRLTDDKLEYWKKSKKNPKGSFEMKDVRVIEEVASHVFRNVDVNHCFQIGNEREYMYIAASSQEEMHDWMAALRQVAQRRGNQMLPAYHPGFELQKRWTCCQKPYDPGENGCTLTGTPPTYKGHAASFSGGVQLSDSSCSTVVGGSVLGESVSTVKTRSFSSDDSTHQSQADIMTPLQDNPAYGRKRDSGYWRSSSTINSLGMKSAISGSQSFIRSRQSPSRSISVESGLGNSRQTLDETNAAGKNECVDFRDVHHQTQEDVLKNGRHLKDMSYGSSSTSGEQKILSTTHRQLSHYPIRAVAFLTQHVVVYATEDNQVCIYSIAKEQLLYDIKLTHPVSTLDVWNDYILVGSSPVQLFEMKADRLRRIVVMDSEDNSQIIQDKSSSHLAMFLPTGHFATARTASNEIVFWPVPSEESSIITKAITRLPIGNVSEYIISMSVLQDSEQPLIAIAKEDSNRAVNVHAFDCRDYTYIKVVDLFLEQKNLSFEVCGRKAVETKYGSPVAVVGRSQSSKAHIPVVLTNGALVLYKDINTFSIFDPEECSKISSLVSMETDGSTVVAAGYDNGKLGLWGEVFEIKPESDKMEELLTTQVLLGDSFYRESLLRDYYEFEVDFNGGRFENYPSYSLKIPRGAIPEGENVVIRTGIMKYGPCGPFKCPENVDIASPVVWLCSNNPNFRFLKPAILELQHCCNSPESLFLLKANHDDMKNTHDMFKFQIQTPSHKLTSGKFYVSTEVTHFCLYCCGIYSNDEGVQRGFRLIPVERIGYMDKTHQVTFCLTYNLDSCQQAVKEQYPSQDYKIKQALPVLFQSDTQIDIYSPDKSDGWLIARTCPGHPIGLEDLNWERNFPTQQALVSAHIRREYPPRFILELCGKDAQRSVTVTVNLTNVTRPVSYDINLYMPCELEEGQEGMQVCPCSSSLSDDSGNLQFKFSFHCHCITLPLMHRKWG